MLRYDNKIPFLVERNIGRGRVLMFSSGMFSSWNDLPRKNAIWLVDRVLRSRLEFTLPERNVESSSAPLIVPIRSTERNAPYVLIRPDGNRQPLEVERIGRDEFGVQVGDFSERGIYRVAVHDPLSTADEPTEKSAADTKAKSDVGSDKSAPDKAAADKTAAAPARKTVEQLIAANGPAAESELASIDEAQLTARLKASAGAAGPPPFRWVARGQPISLSGAEVWGQDTWWWLILALLSCLLIEMLILAWPALMTKREAS